MRSGTLILTLICGVTQCIFKITATLQILSVLQHRTLACLKAVLNCMNHMVNSSKKTFKYLHCEANLSLIQFVEWI